MQNKSHAKTRGRVLDVYFTETEEAADGEGMLYGDE